MKNIAKDFLLISFSVFSSMSFLSCGSDNEADPPYNESFIQKFTKVDRLTAKSDFGATFSESDKIFYFYETATDGEEFYIQLKANSSKGFFSSDDPHLSDSYKEYNKYINIVGDKGFTNQKYRYYGILSEGTPVSVAITDTLSSIVVTCDKSYNASTLANTNINHLITVFFDNPYVIVKNNYQNYKGSDSYVVKRKLANNKLDNVMIDGFPYAFVGNKLSDIDWKKYPFIGNIWLLVFNEKPDMTDSYTFNITITKSDGSILKVSTQPVELRGTE